MSSFCTAKATHIFSAKKVQNICVSLDVNFNESLTNNVVSFEQLGPDFEFHSNAICSGLLLILTAPFKTVTGNILIFFFIFQRKKIRMLSAIVTADLVKFHPPIPHLPSTQKRTKIYWIMSVFQKLASFIKYIYIYNNNIYSSRQEKCPYKYFFLLLHGNKILWALIKTVLLIVFLWRNKKTKITVWWEKNILAGAFESYNMHAAITQFHLDPVAIAMTQSDLDPAKDEQQTQHKWYCDHSSRLGVFFQLNKFHYFSTNTYLVVFIKSTSSMFYTKK